MQDPPSTTLSAMPTLVMRSKLFVPGSRPDLFAKALASEADAISLDLEDAVTEDRKDEARATVREFLLSSAAKASAKILIVRVNALGTAHFEADLHAVAQSGVHLINLPKPERVQDVLAAAQTLAAAEAANAVARPIGLLLNIESPKALRLAHELAAAHPRVMGLQLGLADLFEPLAIDRRDADAVRLAMFTLRMAAGEAGVFAVDSAFADLQDTAGYLAEAQRAQRLGFVGKSCIHPSQVALANGVFRPSDGQITQALKVVAAAQQESRHGATLVEGTMVDGPFVRSAQATLANAERLGLLPATGTRTGH